MNHSVVAAATAPRLLPERHPAAPPRLIRLPASIRANRFRRNEAQNPENSAADCAHQSAHPILCQGRFCAEAPNNGMTCRHLRSAGSGQGTLLRTRVSRNQQVTIGYGPVAPTYAGESGWPAGLASPIPILGRCAGLSAKPWNRLNRTLSGWANYFRLGQVSPAYRAVDQHADRRLRQWLCRKHKVRSGKYVRFPSQQLYTQYGLHRLAPTTKGLPWAKA